MLRVFAVLCALVVMGLVALMLHVGEPDQWWWWTMAIPFGAWITGPAVAPYVVARRRGDGSSRITMMAFFLVSTALAGAIYGDAFFRSSSSTAGLAFLFIPLYQWIAFAIVLAGAAVARRWAKRR